MYLIVYYTSSHLGYFRIHSAANAYGGCAPGRGGGWAAARVRRGRSGRRGEETAGVPRPHDRQELLLLLLLNKIIVMIINMIINMTIVINNNDNTNSDDNNSNAGNNSDNNDKT